MFAKITSVSYTLIYIENIFSRHTKKIVIHVRNNFTIKPLERKTDVARL